MTTTELRNKLVKLENECCAEAQSGDVSEALQLVLVSQDYLAGIIDWAKTHKSLTDSERTALERAHKEVRERYCNVLSLLQERIRKEPAKMINEKGEYIPDPFVEDKGHALSCLAIALRDTRQGEHVWDIKLSDDGETAYICTCRGELIKEVCVACDGALQAIIDVCKALM